MNIKKWFKSNTSSLEGKTVAISGSTGGIGRELCKYMLKLGASLVLLDRNRAKSDLLKNELLSEFTDADIKQLTLDLENIEEVKKVCAELEKMKLYGLVLNAGAYSIPRYKCSTDYDNVFMINFVSPYYMARYLAPHMEKDGRIVAVSSIAHNYSVIDVNDIDFSTRKKASLVYGNAKRHLTYALMGHFETEKNVKLSVTHPGITFTGITNHYPKLIFKVIKHPMKVIFMKPEKACLSILLGLFGNTPKNTWIGPRFFNVWGRPKKKKLKTASEKEQKLICRIAEEIYKEL